MDLGWGNEDGIPCMPPCIPEDGCCKKLGSSLTCWHNCGGCSLHFMVQPFILALLYQDRGSTFGTGHHEAARSGESEQEPLQLIGQGGCRQHISLFPSPKPGPAWPWQFGEVLRSKGKTQRHRSGCEQSGGHVSGLGTGSSSVSVPCVFACPKSWAGVGRSGCLG